MGGEGEGSESGLGRGEKQISLLSFSDDEESQRSSTSFLCFLGFFMGEERFQVTARALQAAEFERLCGRQWGMYPEPEHPAQRWRLYRAFDDGDGGGGAFRQQRRTWLALEKCKIVTKFGALQRG